eukprot:TRINITY_DN12772_c0_g1_i1.p2 TRINITY_DN12772_c0_g1~~TRINITY_DN12772_c0_g1_i1.p2  ORF type:complete len:106 (+),score=9.73 TRINITY_DN12772_c0_g1_i1:114-431(+)
MATAFRPPAIPMPRPTAPVVQPLGPLRFVPRPLRGEKSKRLPPPRVIPRALVQLICGTCRNEYFHSIKDAATGKRVARCCAATSPSRRLSSPSVAPAAASSSRGA